MNSQRDRVVVVNDDKTQLHLITRVLQRFGYDVDGYLGAAEALVDLEERPKVDLFIVDLHMPGIDGWKFCRLLRSPDFEYLNETPILVMSATFSGADFEAITTDLGANAFLGVPFSREQLLEYVAELLEGNRPRSRSEALIVEDDDAVRMSVSRIFEAHGFKVRTAATGAEAKRIWAEHRADVVLLDYHLPDVPCDELLKQFHCPADPTVIIVMTGDTNPALPANLLSAGADGYVRKPFDPEVLIELTRKAQRERSLLRVEAILEQRTQELRSSERRFRQLFDTIPELVMVLDQDDRIRQVNHEVVRTLGRSAASLEGVHFLDLVAPNATPATVVELDDVRSGTSDSLETSMMRVDGTRLEVEATAVLMEDQGESSFLLVARDVTARLEAERERERLNEQVHHAQRLESLGVLAGGIAHDFNNLLVGILGNTSLVLLDYDEEGPFAESLAHIQVAARRAAELTDQILIFSGKGKVTKTQVDVSEVVTEMGPLIEPAISKKAALKYQIGQDLPRVEADPSQIRQVVMNLIMNASEALDGQSGAIHVSTSLVTLTENDLRECYLAEAAKPGRYFCLEVRDDGAGMDQRILNQIFDPFFTTKFAGRGLGLAATLGIVRSHAGLLRVRSKPNEGTNFRVFFPPVQPTSDPLARASAGTTSAPLTGYGTVLVVDDEPAVRHLACAALARSGFDVMQAENGVEGLKMIDTHPGIIAVLLDLTMPEMDGIQVLEQIRLTRPDLPVLLSSGYSDDALPEGTLVAGPTRFLRKPYGVTKLSDALGSLMRAATTSETAI